MATIRPISDFSFVSFVCFGFKINKREDVKPPVEQILWPSKTGTLIRESVCVLQRCVWEFLSSLHVCVSVCVLIKLASVSVSNIYSTSFFLILLFFCVRMLKERLSRHPGSRIRQDMFGVAWTCRCGLGHRMTDRGFRVNLAFLGPNHSHAWRPLGVRCDFCPLFSSV